MNGEWKSGVCESCEKKMYLCEGESACGCAEESAWICEECEAYEDVERKKKEREEENESDNEENEDSDKLAIDALAAACQCVEKRDNEEVSKLLKVLAEDCDLPDVVGQTTLESLLDVIEV